jgi:hypothetical protein
MKTFQFQIRKGRNLYRELERRFKKYTKFQYELKILVGSTWPDEKGLRRFHARYPWCKKIILVFRDGKVNAQKNELSLAWRFPGTFATEFKRRYEYLVTKIVIEQDPALNRAAPETTEKERQRLEHEAEMFAPLESILSKFMPHLEIIAPPRMKEVKNAVKHSNGFDMRYANENV